MTRTLIRGGLVLSMDPETPYAIHSNILIDEGQIVAMGHNLEAAEAAEQIDASGMLVMPGLVNAHLHSWQTPLRGLAANWSLSDYMQKMLGQIGPKFSPEDIYWATYAAALDQIDAGVTTIIDWCHNTPTTAHANAAMAALHDAGIRALFLYGVTTSNTGLHAFGIDKLDEITLPDGAGDLLSLGMSILGPAYAPLDQVRLELDRANALKQIVSMHYASDTNSCSFRQLATEGRITEQVNIVHGNGLDVEEIRALVQCSATFTVTPEVEMQMGFGPGITGHIRSQGGKPSLGVDTEASSSHDMFQVIRFALQLQRFMDHQHVQAQTKNGVEGISNSAYEALTWATVEGARTAGLSARIGSLIPGKQADLIMVRMPDLRPGIDPIQLLVSRAMASDIDTVFIRGKLKKQSGKRIGTSRNEIAKKLSRIALRVL
ncbi:amidohydrolase family protein [Hafnia paralvei]|jgi:5-methylthioadenosine/S-adenosylhomocysteine deaminase|uniref:amidohydrolase family protein n=1 Tax=Hafnia paralvei TaxID=546367 RepID=UPI000660B087|nr:amidohydrolase family protein [Hafnia paralvei]MCK2181808.1 amidohydrolase family protein [Hafnia paralvei]TBL56253.1 hypothetical protein EYZ00_01515 [Hafnia paralvei]TBM23468.1 hypothetical protein EYY85_17625 [Hafnia paralvei]